METIQAELFVDVFSNPRSDWMDAVSDRLYWVSREFMDGQRVRDGGWPDAGWESFPLLGLVVVAELRSQVNEEETDDE